MQLARLRCWPRSQRLRFFPERVFQQAVALSKPLVHRRGRISLSSASYNFTMPPSQQHASPKSKVLVMGSGNFGSCLADHLGDSDHHVLLWSRSKEIVQHFNVHHKNPKYLTDHYFPACIQAIGPDLPSAEVLEGRDVLIFAIPTEALRYSAGYLRYCEV